MFVSYVLRSSLSKQARQSLSSPTVCQELRESCRNQHLYHLTRLPQDGRLDRDGMPSATSQGDESAFNKDLAFFGLSARQTSRQAGKPVCRLLQLQPGNVRIIKQALRSIVMQSEPCRMPFAFLDFQTPYTQVGAFSKPTS